jgi:hypothetical protein
MNKKKAAGLLIKSLLLMAVNSLLSNQDDVCDKQ